MTLDLVYLTVRQATRTVHFLNDQVYWECKEMLANEVWPNGWKNTPLEHRLNHAPGNTLQFKFGNVLSDHVRLSRLKNTPA